MRFTAARRLGFGLTLAAAATMAASPAFAATTAAAPRSASTATAVAASACEVTDATIVWGFKESFRSYISGSIASGSWEVRDGASYETPSFTFTGTSGTLDPEAHTVTAPLPGAIDFTGHGGLLATSVSNPTVSVTGPTTGQLLLDISTVTMDQALAGDKTPHTYTQVPFVDIDLAAATFAVDGEAATFTVDGAPTTITQAGYDAFGSYDAGTAFDPISITVHATCEPEAEPTPSATAAVEATPEESTDAAADAASDTSATSEENAWVPWVIGVAVVAVAAVVLALVATTRARSRRTTDAATDDPQAPSDH